MNLETERLKQFAPLALPLVIVVVGWMFLIRPTASGYASVAREVDGLQQRLAQVRASVSEPPPPVVSADPRAAFERQVPAHDSSYQVFEQLARLARTEGGTNLLIETAERVVVTAPTGPQVTGGGARPDPRLALFETPLAYSPISMSFDAEFARLGQFLWSLRDLATTVEIRSLDIKPRLRDGSGALSAAGDRRVHVALTLFAYARENAAMATAGVSR